MANERRLIDANALPFITLKDNSYWARSVCYKSDVDAAPTVDAVEVVRCRDCKYCRLCACPNGAQYVTCERYFIPKLLNDYCSYGEKNGTQLQREDV